jgi:hypothetical protein
MRRFNPFILPNAVVIVLVALLAVGSPIHAQDDPQYSVVISSYDGAYLASFYGGSDWRVTRLPNAAFFGQGDVALQSPLWMGRRLIVAAYGDNDTADRLTEYDFATGELSPFFVSTGTLQYETIVIEGVSPDGNQMLVSNLYQSQWLLDAASGAVIGSFECAGGVIGWTDQYVLTVTPLCATTYAAINRETGSGAVADDLFFDVGTIDYMYCFVCTNVSMGANSALDNGLYPINGSIFGSLSTSDGESEIVFIGGDPLVLTSIAKGDLLAISPSRTFATFINDGQLYRIDLATWEITSVGNIGESYWFRPYSYDDSDAIQYIVETDDGYEAVIVGKETLTRREVLITDVPGSDRLMRTTSPNGRYLAQVSSTTGASDVVQLQWEGGLYTYVPENADTHLDIQFSPDSDWLHIHETVLNSGRTDTISVNTQTEQIYLPPAPGMRLIGTSPDGVWWLYSQINMEMDADRLVVYSRSSGDVIPLLENVALGERNFHFPPSAYYVWSDEFTETP